MKKLKIVFLAFFLVTGLIGAEQKKNFPSSSKPIDHSQPKPYLSSITVLTPNGGETWGKGGTGIITWSMANVTQNVNIILKATNSVGGEFTIRANLPPTANKVVYLVPTNFGYDGKVFKVIISTVDGKIKDESDDTFTIRAMNFFATLASTPENYTGACPVTINFSGTITAEFPCDVTYYFFNHDDGTQSPNYTTYVNGSKTVPYSRQVTGSHSGHTTLYVTAPGGAKSNTAYFTVVCAQQVK